MADGTLDPNAKPTEDVSVREVFGIDTDMIVRASPSARTASPNSTRPTSSTPTRRSPSSLASPTTAA
jgi:hypothetical protein